MINKKVRSLLFDIHLWLGLGASVILFLVCLSGTVLVFEDEVTRAFNQNVYYNTSSGQELLSREELYKTALAQGEKVMSISFYEDVNRSAAVRVFQEGSRRGKLLHMDRYTGEFLGQPSQALKDFFMFNFRMHRWLLLDTKIGRPIVGISTIIFVILSVSGLVLWLPRKFKKAQFRKGLRLKLNAGWKRINYDLHNTLGFYTLLILLIMSLSGLFWSFDWYRAGMYSFFGVERKKEQYAVQSNESDERLSLDKLAEISAKQLGYEGDLTFRFPKKKNEPYSISAKNPADLLDAYDRLTMNPYTGETIKADLFEGKHFGEKVMASIKAIHVGFIFGKLSKIIYFLSCLVATSLPITGFFMWLNRRKKKH
ncbi:PepSY-associated TM helix domain-containing protein [Aureibacter tunicatorum]|uniref:Iron-regulated membrane protein n=1 Tax=Aureibacter tunicatorum TaxID=866807 RepID=A0AAE3XQ15_9BACT|nr:PepSY-associated TM helix domain-containing protein [Aureibacter tunicatorum]MDR6240515.1 putative iron-regulated membrane protein [Aureibacter tunicatorum]BDD06624.1 membrane protein [Aureibacter tunicatorum]